MTPRLLRMTVVGVICFLIGWAITRPIFSNWLGGFGAFASPVPKAGSTPAFEAYAFILVDDYGAAQPRVEAVWLTHVSSDYSTADLAGLPPTQFRDQFSRALNGVPLLTLQPYLRGRLFGTVTLDRDDVKELVERIGGAYVFGQKMDGAGLLAYMDAAEPAQVGDLLMRQAAVIQSLLAQMAAAGSQLDLAGLIQTPSYCSIEQNKLYELVLHYYPVRTDTFHVHPQLDSAP